MGSWFTNLHIRGAGLTMDPVIRAVSARLEEQGFVPAEPSEADGTVAILPPEQGGWYSVYSDLWSFEDPSRFSALAEPLSRSLSGEVLGIGCFDSDYLYLNLIDAGSGTDAWLGVGSPAPFGIRRRTGWSAWKKRVPEPARFREAGTRRYICAEEALEPLGEQLGISMCRGSACLEYLEELGLKENAHMLWFKLPPQAASAQPPRLSQKTYSLMPCFVGRPSTVSAVNLGDPSRGLSVYFLGPFVQEETLAFSQVAIVSWKGNSTISKPIRLTKEQLPDGSWAYAWHDPAFRIPGRVDERLPMSQRMRQEHERSVIFRFVPQGDPRKILDISVAIVPHKNREGGTLWNVWQGFGSREAFIRQHNETWSAHPGCEQLLLCRDDFD